VLQVPGDIDDYDESLWSKPLADKHLEQVWEIQTGVYRVLYVNGDRWCPWPTAAGIGCCRLIGRGSAETIVGVRQLL
jgi:hypothetical protein